MADEMLEKNKGKYFVGRAGDFAKRKGWFFGHFMDEGLLKSDLVEVAWQDISGKVAEPGDKHLHTSSVEINIVISGRVSLVIGGEKVTVGEGEFYVVWPEAVVEEVTAGEDTRLIVIRAPGVNDKKVLAE